MENQLQREIVLKLNKNWIAIESVTVGEAVTFLCSMSDGRHPGYAIDFSEETDSTGHPIILGVRSWEEWMRLPVRPSDQWIGVGRSEFNPDGRIRLPVVVICANYDKLRLRKARWSADAVRARDGDTCQISGIKLAPGEGNVGHDVAQSVAPARKRDWTNTAWVHKGLNTKQGTKTFAEAGYKLIRKPSEPRPVPPMTLLRQKPRHALWHRFLELPPVPV